MKRILYFDAFAGVSGDMFVGALVDLGARLEQLQKQVASLGLGGVELRARKVTRRGIAGTKFDVVDPGSGLNVDDAGGHHHGTHDHTEHHHHGPADQVLPSPHRGVHEHRGLREIRSIVRRGALPAPVVEDALAVFELLASAEARVHGVEPDQIHFHEIGALDAIADIVAATSALHQIGPEEVWCSPVHVGSGTVRCAHGVLPVPAPATVELLRGIPVYSDGTRGELATPTGVALLKHFCKGFCPIPPMVVEAAGYGAGSRDLDIPNLLRVVQGRVGEKVWPLQATASG